MSDSIRQRAINQARAEGLTDPVDIGKRAGQLAKEECIAQIKPIIKAKIAYIETLNPRYDYSFDNIEPLMHIIYSQEELDKLDEFDERIACIQRSALGIQLDLH